MTVVVTGAAGFIGYHVCRALLDRGGDVVGVDQDVAGSRLKSGRLGELGEPKGWRFIDGDITQLATVERLLADFGEVATVVHLAAQPGVRLSLERPIETTTTNVVGQVAVFEAVRRSPASPHVVYASSSSVYGNDSPLPLSERQERHRPASLYGLTKLADELIAAHYADAWGVQSTGLRFFTVYGPWGRPDMAPWLFASAMLAGRPIRVFNHGRHERDFTYIDDIVAGVLAAIDRASAHEAGGVRHAIYNLGGSRRVPLLAFIAELERATGAKALIEFAPMQTGDVRATEADIERARRDLGFQPKVSLAEGLARFVAWLGEYERRA
ncbi:MAG: NAD-dependent epimerase/dehydratase family protein [Bauldia sp.]